MDWVSQSTTCALVCSYLILKSKNPAIDSSCCQIAILHVCVRLWAVCAGFQEGIWLTNIFHGYNLITFAVVVNLAFSGLLVSWVMKFADSIMKVALPLCLAIALLY